MSRPELSPDLSSDEFVRWYWLKEELTSFCRRYKLASHGSKPDLTRRIAAHLAGEQIQEPSRPARSGNMPAQFALHTLIGDGWRCNPSLGAFLRSQCGNRFRFNSAIRNFIHTQRGRTLAEAVECYRQSVAPGAPRQEIIPQNEYNRHTREFFAEHPGATREQALEAWKRRRAQTAV
jgi:SAP domain-containing new25/Domain of unknown function (DUF6434)